MSWIRKIKQALEANELVFLCQPIRRLAGYSSNEELHELLVRYQEGDRLVSAYEFIDEIAAEEELMRELDRQAVAYALSLNRGRTAINLSSATLGDFMFLRFLENQLDRHQKSADTLCFEVTEQDALACRSTGIIRAIKSMGFQVGLDDFGCGYNSFPALLVVEPSFIKIDGRFIYPLCQDRMARAIVKGIFVIAMDLNIDIIAERIETQEIENEVIKIKEEIAELVRVQGQGWLYGKPRQC